MALPWLAVLKAVPWSEVMSNAPRLIDGAKKLWTSTKAAPRPPVSASSPKGEAAPMDTRIATLEAEVAELHAQLRASSDLIKELADLNGQLIRRIEANRVRLRWVTIALVLVAVLAVTALVR